MCRTPDSKEGRKGKGGGAGGGGGRGSGMEDGVNDDKQMSVICGMIPCKRTLYEISNKVNTLFRGSKIVFRHIIIIYYYYILLTIINYYFEPSLASSLKCAIIIPHLLLTTPLIHVN